MRYRFRVLMCLAVCLVPVRAIFADELVGPHKAALLVGVNQYLKPGFRDLEFAEADVIAVGEQLERLGFEVTVLLGSGTGERQATLANLDAAARKLVAPLGKSDVALVMLSGHGQTLRRSPGAQALDESFFCPVDAVSNDPTTQFSLSLLLDSILAPNVGRKLVLVDACRDVPADASRGARNIKGIEGRVVSLPEDSAIFFSCRAGQQSFERHELGHGLFTHCVLEGLQGAAVVRGELSWSGLVNHVGRRMTDTDLVRFMPSALPQVPILAGTMPHTVLGTIDIPVTEAPSGDAPAAAMTKPLEPDDQLRREFEEFEATLQNGRREIGSEQARRYVSERAGRRLSEWRKAAEGGSAIANFFVARCLQHGLGTAKNETEALAHYQRAAEGGIGLAWNSLGAAFETGRGVEKDLIRAAECYRQGGELGCATAFYNLGFLYEEGRGASRSQTEAFECFRRSAEAGDSGGMTKLALCYQNGLGTTRDIHQAIQWYEQAIARGNTAAMNLLGYMYYSGDGVAQDYYEAKRLYRMGADLQDAESMWRYGATLTQNDTAFEDDQEGIRWMLRAWEELKAHPEPWLRDVLIEDLNTMGATIPR